MSNGRGDTELMGKSLKSLNRLVDNLRTLVELHEGMRKATQWRNISSAPMDGTDILLWFGPRVGWIQCGRFFEGHWRDSWAHKKLDRVDPPTLWMPMPEEPNESWE
jgi:hypothetical protein